MKKSSTYVGLPRFRHLVGAFAFSIIQSLWFIMGPAAFASEMTDGPIIAPPKGEFYETLAPETLDLAQRGHLALNAVTGAVSPELDYEFHWIQNLIPPGVTNHSHQWFDLNPRGLEIMMTQRLMTGSNYKLDIEQGMYHSMLSRLGEDGLYYNAPVRDDAPWRAGGKGGRKIWGTKEDISGIWGNAQFLVTLIYRYRLTQDPLFLEKGRGLAKGLIRIAIRKDDYAFYPATPGLGFDHGYLRESGWPETEEALDELDSPEGTVSCYIAVVVRALSMWYAETGDPEALEMAGLLANYVLKPQFWMGDIQNWGEEIRRVWQAHGGLQRKPAALFKGHIAGIAYTLQGLIDYAYITNDAYVKEFVRQAYEYVRNFGLVRIGLHGENIANSIMAVVAIRMTDCGIGDYYEDVDQHIRNQMVEDQFTDAEMLRKLNEQAGHDLEGLEFTIERILGSLNHESAFGSEQFLDPTGLGTYASPYLEPYYYIWESIIRHQEDGTCHVNLLLNRASPWLDLDSYLPYEGRVVIRNKTAKNIFIRIPRWVAKDQVKCIVNDKDTVYFWSNNYLGLTNLTGKETVTVTFPMVETTETYYLLPYDTKPKWFDRIDSLPKYVLHFKGNTCVQAEFPNKADFGGNDYNYPIYQRERYREDKAPMKKVNRFIAEKLVKW